MFLFGPIGPLELIIILVLIVPYFVPSIIAFSRKHQNATAIFALNLLLGWTIIGWIACLVWALTAKQVEQTINITTASPQPPQQKSEPSLSPKEQEKKFCSKCGTSIKSSDIFCSKCGEKLA